MPESIEHLMEDADWKREFQYVLFARRSVILTTGLAVVAGAILMVLFSPPRYESNASVLVRGTRAEVSPSTLDSVEPRTLEVSDRDVISEMEILRAPELARRVSEQLREESNWEAVFKTPLPHGSLWVSQLRTRIASVPWLQALLGGVTEVDPSHKAGAMGDARVLLQHLDVSRVPLSSVVRIRFEAPSRAGAEIGLEALLDQYIPYRAEVFNPPVGQEAFFENRMAYYRGQLQALADRIAEENGDSNPAFIEMRVKSNLERLVALQQRLAELEMELATSVFVDNQPLLKRITVVQEAIAQLERENRVLEHRRLAAEALHREAQLISHSLQTFARRAEEARINDSIAQNNLAGDIRVLSRASGTGVLVFPRRGPIILLGLLAAVVAGISIGFLAEFFDHTVRRAEDIHRAAGLPVIGSVPHL